jgi:hypothetical protein
MEMRPMLMDPLTAKSAWRSSDIQNDTSWCLQITESQREELIAATEGVVARGLRVPDFGRSDFPLPELEPILTRTTSDLEEGRGVALLRGLPFDRQDETRAAVLLWGVCSYLGRAIPQHAAVNLGGYRDNLVAHIVNQGYDYNQTNVHGSLTSAEQMPHCDPSDLVALLCVRPAADGGGISRIVSAMAIYNEILDKCPEVLDALYEGFYHDLRDQAADGGTKVTPFRIPVFSYYNQVLSCNFNSKTAEAAVMKLGRQFTESEAKAIRTMVGLATNPEFAYDMRLSTGDLQILNNYTILHSRGGWHDPDAYEEKRVMLRLWLRSFTPRPLSPDFVGGYVTGAKHNVAAVTS